MTVEQMTLPAGQAPSFDDLGDFESVDSNIDLSDVPEVKEETEEVKEETKDEEAPEQESKDEIDPDRDEDGSKPEEKEEKPDPKEEDGKKEEDEDGEEKDQKESKRGRPKTIKGKVGEEDVDIRADATFQVKVDGEKVDVTAQDLINNFSSQKHLGNKLASIKSQEAKMQADNETLTAEKQELVGYISDIMEKVDGEKPFEALTKIIELSGKKAYDIEASLIKHFTPIIEDLQEMDDGERQAFFLKRENDYLKSHTESVKGRFEAEASKRESVAKVAEMREAHGVSEEDYQKAESDLLEDGTPKSEVKPAHVVTHHLKMVAVDKAESLLKEIDPKLVDDDAKVVNLAEFLFEEPGLDREDILTELRGMFGSSESEDDEKELIDKIAKKSEGREPPKQPSKAFEEGHVESFDDYEY